MTVQTIMEPNHSSVHSQRGHVAGLVEIGISHWPAAVTSIVLLVAAFAFQNYFKEDPIAKLPRVGDPDLTTRWKKFIGPGSWDMYKEGYEKVKRRAMISKFIPVLKFHSQVYQV